jgi:hypothetical protein
LTDEIIRILTNLTLKEREKEREREREREREVGDDIIRIFTLGIGQMWVSKRIYSEE